ncbi:hypothetical protein NUW58_g10697 [Xylaria curta]|uniref:Uncharacterized protein n=1 Tax=Xylaria curta TaxID=42375 RepID=A0ACC1MI22_9PEZI|nr:hypothetical protein NUW58_g10697 [Xylaria curta]
MLSYPSTLMIGLQRGRETPTQKTRDEPNPSTSRNQTRSLTPDRNPAVESSTAPKSVSTQSPIKGETQPTSFLADFDGSDTSSIVSPKPLPSPHIHLRRPSDRQHPAFRDSALPTPLSLITKPQDEPSTERPSSLAVDSKGISPADSPTLGPATAGSGLGGMVRQHLRADSNASSIYEGVPSTSGLESRFPAGTTNSSSLQEYGAGSNPWEGGDHGRDWNLDLDVNEPLADTESFVSDSSRRTEGRMDFSLPGNGKTDEFANQLADGARRIRERLTSYVETDSRSSSPHRIGEQNGVVDLAPLPRPSGLGAILRPRSSRGSLIDHGRDSSAKAFKMMGISPGGSRTASPGSESQRVQIEADSELALEREEKEPARAGDDQHPGLHAITASPSAARPPAGYSISAT